MTLTYQLTSGSAVLRSDGVCIPADEMNTDWQEYQAWLANGGVPEPVAGPTDAERWMIHQSQAQAALDASDITVLRCVEHGVTVPAEWATYRADLRAIVSASTGDATQPLPTRPAYPAGT